MRKAVIQRVDTFLFHGEPWFEIAFTYLDEPDAVHAVRMGNDGVPPHTQPGDIVWVATMMNTVTGFHRNRPAD